MRNSGKFQGVPEAAIDLLHCGRAELAESPQYRPLIHSRQYAAFDGRWAMKAGLQAIQSCRINQQLRRLMGMSRMAGNHRDDSIVKSLIVGIVLYDQRGTDFRAAAVRIRETDQDNVAPLAHGV
jgi:hypothetical protein